MVNHPLLLHVQRTSGTGSYRNPCRCFTISRCFETQRPITVFTRAGHWILSCQQIGFNTFPSSSIGSIFRRVPKIAKSDYYFSHVCPSIHMIQLGSYWTDFREVWYLSVFRKSVKKIQFSLKSDKNNGYHTWRTIYVFDHI